MLTNLRRALLGTVRWVRDNAALAYVVANTIVLVAALAVGAVL